MSSTYSPGLRLELQADGENSGTWGQKTNANLGTLMEQAISGWFTFGPTGNTVLTALNGITDQARYAMIKLDATGAPTGAFTLTIPSVSKQYIIDNQSGQTVTVQTVVAASASMAIATGFRAMIYCDGSNVANSFNGITGGFGVSGALGVTGAVIVGNSLAVGGNISVAGVINEAPLITVPSASTADIFAVTSNNVAISGTTTIASLGNSTGAQSGAVRQVVFTGILTLTNSSSLILPGAGANITTAAGDTAVFVGEGVNVRCIAYQRASGASVIPPVTPAAPTQYYHGRCRLTLSGANLLLSPHDGNGLMISGATQAVPAAGVSLAPTSLTPNQLYYIYAYMNSGVMTLEASVTTHATDATTGIEIKSGDATRTLVGMAEPTTGPAWLDTNVTRAVASYFCRRNRACVSAAASPSTSATSPVEVTTLTVNFLIWGDEDVSLSTAGYGYNAATSSYAALANGFDGSITGVINIGYSTAPNAYVGLTTTALVTAPSEGAHYSTPQIFASGGTAGYSLQTYAMLRI